MNETGNFAGSTTMKRRSNRREFLRGQAATDALADLGRGGEADGGGAAETAGGWIAAASLPYQVRMQRPAMACTFEVVFNAGQHSEATDAALSAFELIDQLEGQLTIYRQTSEVSRINARAAGEAVPVEPRLFALLTLAVELHRQTGGAFDIASGRLTKAWGFDRRAGRVPCEEDLAAARADTGSQHLVLDADEGTIEFLRPGVELNLGSIGKGYALDRAAELMAAAGVGNFLWQGGQSSVLARGDSGAAPGRGWVVGVRDPLRPSRRLAEITLVDRALATSGASVQFFRQGGKRYGHILDPRSGWPAEGVFSATVVAPTAAEADALATACYVLGVDAALQLARRRGDLGLLIVFPSDTASRVQVAAEGFGEGQCTFLADS